MDERDRGPSVCPTQVFPDQSPVKTPNSPLGLHCIGLMYISSSVDFSVFIATKSRIGYLVCSIDIWNWDIFEFGLCIHICNNFTQITSRLNTLWGCRLILSGVPKAWQGRVDTLGVTKIRCCYSQLRKRRNWEKLTLSTYYILFRIGKSKKSAYVGLVAILCWYIMSQFDNYRSLSPLIWPLPRQERQIPIDTSLCSDPHPAVIKTQRIKALKK